MTGRDRDALFVASREEPDGETIEAPDGYRFAALNDQVLFVLPVSVFVRCLPVEFMTD